DLRQLRRHHHRDPRRLDPHPGPCPRRRPARRRRRHRSAGGAAPDRPPPADRPPARAVPRRLEEDRADDRMTDGRDSALPRLAGLRARPDAARAAEGWLEQLASERRAAALTLEAYGRDIRQFFAFLTDHLGGEPGLDDLARPAARDFRAFLAARRRDGIAGRSLARSLSAIRSLFRYLHRTGKADNAALSTLRTPKIGRGLPKALSVDAAVRMVADEPAVHSDGTPTWIRLRDVAVLTLLYGSGLRLSEALSLNRSDAPVAGHDALRITGKGGRTR